MNGSKACRFWVNMVKYLGINTIVPQHGSPFFGDKMVNQFIHWVENLECGLDLFTQENYQIPQ
jgi:flavorubredoxin